MGDATTVVAVVVTWNRAELLDTLLGALAGQTHRLDQVLVVDNASTDNTQQVLASWVNRVDDGWLHVLRLDTNTGGAGGFAAGLHTAINSGSMTATDLVWLMDDDGLPPPAALEDLLQHRPSFDFWGPAVVDQADPQRLVFPIRLPGTARVVHDLADVEAAATASVLPDVVIPFNGVLVTVGLARRIGVPRAEFFIWGDDVEYLWRAKKAGARTGTITSVHLAHPSVGELGRPMMWGKTTYNHSPSDLKHYCLVRNNTVNLRDYYGWAAVGAFWVKTLWFYLFTVTSSQRLRLSARAAFAGLRGDFTGHERFLT